MARTSVLLPLLAESAAASSLVEQAKSYGAQAVAYSQANPIAAVAVALVAIGCATMLFAPSKLERDASGGTGATFNSYSKAGKMLSNKARARAFFRRALPTVPSARPRAAARDATLPLARARASPRFARARRTRCSRARR